MTEPECAEHKRSMLVLRNANSDKSSQEEIHSSINSWRFEDNYFQLLEKVSSKFLYRLPKRVLMANPFREDVSAACNTRVEAPPL